MNIPVLSDLRHDPDPLPRAAPVGPGSLYRSVAEAVLVEPASIEAVAAPSIAPRREQPLGSWRFTADPAGAPIPEQHPCLGDGRPVAVPHTWSRTEPELVDFKGPAWYATGVVADPSLHHHVRFGGLDYVGSVWANGALLGHHEGGFTPVAFDLPPFEGEAALVVRVDDPVEPALVGPKPLTDAKRKVKGVFEFHDSRPGGHSHGIWFSPLWGVRWGTGGMVEQAVVVSTGEVRLDATFVTAGSGRLAISWVLVNLAAEPVDVELVCSVAGAGLRVTATIPSGASRVAVAGALADADAWAPVAGPGHRAAVHQLATEVRVGGVVSDADRTTFGVRTIEMPLVPDDQFRIRVDGRRTYVRGANYIPGVWIPELSERTFRLDLELAAAAGVNSFGPHAHVLPERFYDAADEAGMLVYQDFPLNLANDPGGAPLFEGGPTMGEASLLLAAEVTYRLYNHPSVVYWCGHNEPAYQLAQVFSGGTHPNIVELGNDLAAAPDEEPFDDARVALWNRLDPTRPAYKASGLGRHAPVGDSHTYTGSLNTDPTTAVSGARATFMSEFGAWTTNFSAEGSAPGASGSWPPDPATVGDWEQRTHMWLGTATKTGRPARYPDYATWTYATQLWAGTWLKMAVESFRRHKWDPQGAHRYHLFVDHWGDAGAGVIDKHRLPQLHYWSMAAAHRLLLPVVGVTASMRAEPGVELVLPTWVCNDLDAAVEGARLSWSIRRLAAEEAFVIGVDDAQTPSRFGDPVVPRGDLVVVPRGQGVEVASGSGTVSVGADAVAPGPAVTFTPPAGDEPVAYAVLVRLDVPDGEPVDSWSAFVAAPPAWDPAPGITPMPRFTLTLTGSGPYRLVRRWTGSTVGLGALDAVVADLAPGQYLVEAGSRVLAIDLYGDVAVDVTAGTAAPDSPLPWAFDPLSRL
jgi:beta-mannosidase